MAISGGTPPKPPKTTQNRGKGGILRTPPKKGVILGGVPPKTQKNGHFLKKWFFGVQKSPEKCRSFWTQKPSFSKKDPKVSALFGTFLAPFLDGLREIGPFLRKMVKKRPFLALFGAPFLGQKLRHFSGRGASPFGDPPRVGRKMGGFRTPLKGP